MRLAASYRQFIVDMTHVLIFERFQVSVFSVIQYYFLPTKNTILISGPAKKVQQPAGFFFISLLTRAQNVLWMPTKQGTVD